MSIPAKLVKELREFTGAPFMEYKKALVETGGDLEKAQGVLRKQGHARADKKANRATNQGWLGHYVHSNGRIGVLIQVFCETDFVAKNDVFQELIKDLSMHISWSDPQALRPEDLSPELVEKKRGEFAEDVATQNKDKPPEIQDKIIEGRMKKFFAEVCLLQQPFVKDDKKTVEEHIKEKIATIGENITVGRFHRMELGSS